MKIILVNGSSGSGKTTLIQVVIKQLKNAINYPMSRPLKEGVKAIFDVGGDVELMKLLIHYPDEAVPQLGNMSYRSAQIRIYKEYIVPSLGEEGLAYLATRHIKGMICNTAVIDIGLECEANVIRESFGYANVGLITLERPGIAWKGDYRESIDDHYFKYYEHINNKYDLELFAVQITKVLRKWELVDANDN